MNYCKITTTKSAQIMPNPYHLTVANPTDATKAVIAGLDNWLPMTYTEQPTYDPETQYLTEYWENENGTAVQHWEIHDLPTPEPTLEDRVEDLEGGMDALVGDGE